MLIAIIRDHTGARPAPSECNWWSSLFLSGSCRFLSRLQVSEGHFLWQWHWLEWHWCWWSVIFLLYQGALKYHRLVSAEWSCLVAVKIGMGTWRLWYSRWWSTYISTRPQISLWISIATQSGFLNFSFSFTIFFYTYSRDFLFGDRFSLRHKWLLFQFLIWIFIINTHSDFFLLVEGCQDIIACHSGLFL